MLKKKFFKSKEETEVTFEFAREDVSNVAIAGDFNQWQPAPMKYVKKDNVFRTRIRLPKNQDFSFRYLLNEKEWENDYAADAYIPNPYGTENSVVSTQPA